MKFSSANMHYVFSVEYFKGVDLSGDTDTSAEFSARNGQLRNFCFPKDDPFAGLRSDPRFRSFRLYTSYPGLLIGTGYPHDSGAKGAVSLGFSLDYVSGMPYLPGSSLKGILRSYFSIRDLVRTFLDPVQDLKALETEIFEHGDTFLGAYPVLEKSGALLELESITPHPGAFEDPVPLSLLKVKPDVPFEFGFLMEEGAVPALPVGKRLALFRTLLTELGVGAKTNVGFGRMTESPAGPNVLAFDNGLLHLVPDEAVAANASLPEQPAALADGAVLGPCPKCGAEVRRQGAAAECSGHCGIRFKKVMGTEIGDRELASLLSGESIDIPVFDSESGTERRARVRIGREGGAWRPDGKNGEKKGIYRPNYMREWLGD